MPFSSLKTELLGSILAAGAVVRPPGAAVAEAGRSCRFRTVRSADCGFIYD
jgi:hypothetical protein